MIKKILMVLGLGIAGFLIFVSTKPDTFNYSRSIVISAPADNIFPLINDFKAWPQWSPYEKTDPNMKKTLSTPSSGVGAYSEWEGNAEAGAGRIEIINALPSTAVSLRLLMHKPFEADNQVEFILIPQANGTQVTWAMSGKNNFLGKLIGTIINCEKMVGGQFEEGLSNLKKVVEGPAVVPSL